MTVSYQVGDRFCVKKGKYINCEGRVIEVFTKKINVKIETGNFAGKIVCIWPKSIAPIVEQDLGPTIRNIRVGDVQARSPQMGASQSPDIQALLDTASSTVRRYSTSLNGDGRMSTEELRMSIYIAILQELRALNERLSNLNLD